LVSPGDALQARHILNGRTRRGNEHCDGLSQHDHGLRLRQVADITANDREIELSRGKRVRRLQCTRSFENLEPDRRIDDGKSAYQGGHDFWRFAVD
jgi:hypothetical protein